MKKLKLGITLTALILFMLSMSSYGQQLIYGQMERPVQVSANRNGPPVYEQYSPLGDGFISSQEYTDPGLAANTTFAADDFIVPAGETWDVSYVNLAGAYFDWVENPIYAINLFIYTDNNGIPGEVIHSLTYLSDYNEIEIQPLPRVCKYEITLPEAIQFTEGHYWICAQSVGDESNRWGWMTHSSPTIEYEYQWKNPGDGLGWGYTDWTAGSAISWGDYNLAFGFYGAGPDNDLSMVSIDQPVTGAELSSAEQITVSVKNESTSVMTGFDLSYSVDGGAVVTENVGSFSLAANQIGQYTFTATADFSTPGIHQVQAVASAAGDPMPGNDTVNSSLYNLGIVYTMPATGSQTITSCGATFTDSGGLEGNFGDFDNAITTINPANAGDRVRLTFLEFDASWGGFKIFNGPDTLAPLMGTWFGTNGPGVVTALNASGSLTIHFMGPQWENTTGWVAFISCITPVADDFAITDMNCSLATIFVGDVPVLSAKVQNYGSSSQEKTVTFTANGVEIGSQLTGLLGPADTTWVSVPWTPVEAGNFILEVSVPSDDGLDPNDFMILEKQVYPFGAFFEDFEGEQFPPENWRHGGLWAKNSYDPYTGNFYAECFIGYTQSDTLISPRLNVEAGGVLTFSAKTSLWWPGNLDIYWIEEATGIRSFVQNIVMDAFSYNNFEVDLSAHAGIGRIGFFVNVTDPYAFSGQVLLDNVLGNGITIYFDDYDLKAKELAGNVYYNVNEEAIFTFNVRNDGLMAVPSGEYTVKLMKGGAEPEMLVSLPGNDIAGFETQTYEFLYSFNSIGEFPVYAEIEYAADEYPVNNQSQAINLHGLASASEVVAIGTDMFYANWPIEFTLKKSLSETIYTKDEINRTGVIFGIGYEYNFKADEQDAPVRIWMGETDTLNLQTWIPATEMTLVYEGLLNIPKGKHTAYIPFQTPFNYSDGSKNLIIMTEKIGDHSRPDQIYYSYSAMYMSTLVTASDVSIPDPYNPPTTGGLSTNLSPNIRFVFNDNLGFAGGTVSEQGGAPIEGAKVVIEELNITGYTDASGNYQLPYVPAGDFSATADKFTYQPLTKTLAVTTGNATDLDFELGLLDLLTISGHITGNNDPTTGIADATVILTGYSDYTVTSGSDGNFNIEGVYSNNTYQITVTADGYDAYTSYVVVENSAIDLGEITLTESLLIPYIVNAQTNEDQAVIEWAVPSPSAQQVIAFDDGTHENGYAGEPFETVWMGNYFPMDQMATVTSFDIYWAGYSLITQQVMHLDIFDEQANLIISSDEFLSGIDEWVNVDIPNLTLQGNIYAMVRWSGEPTQSTFMAFDSATVTPNNARYLYPDGTFGLLSDLIGLQGSFLIHANVMLDGDAKHAGRAVNSYNISLGMVSDIANAGNWTMLNSEPLTLAEFTDINWPPAVSGDYVYAVKAIYTNGESEFSFSNILDFLFVGTTELPETKVSIYPNPATEYVMVSGSLGSEIVLFGMDGRLLFNAKIDSDNYQMDVSKFGVGTYLVVVYNETGFSQQKLLIK